jgi:D-beta-D-heptose 7-phosphate kinase/D-beta-D-heptose 1-phosphate adenosyltransferase
MSGTLSDLLDAFSRLSVLVIGDAMLDCYLEGSTGRLCSEAPVPVVDLVHRHEVPGGAANAAANARSLGAQVRLLSVIGSDAHGRRLREVLLASGVGVGDLIARHHRTTLAKERVIADGQMLVRFDNGSTGPIDSATENVLLERLSRGHAKADAVIVSDYGYGILTPRVIAHLAALQARDPRVLLLDSKDLPAYREAGVTVAKPNFAQASRLLGLNGSCAGLESRIQAIAAHQKDLLERTGARLAAVTLDTDGALILERGGGVYRTYARPVRQARTAGAGDTFGAAFALALAAGAPVAAAADLASAAAAVVVAKDGTAVCDTAELHQSLELDPKLMPDRARLASCVEEHRLKGRRIVFTNGCFDLLHRGHIAYLNRAKSLADVLIVGVNTDAGVRRLKGADRPINPLADRIEVLAALAAVDYIVPFEEETPEALISIIRPDVFVKGGDYRRDQLPEAGLVEALGGTLQLLPFLEDRSTTGIIERIRQRATEEGAAA